MRGRSATTSPSSPDGRPTGISVGHTTGIPSGHLQSLLPTGQHGDIENVLGDVNAYKDLF
jgi:hypothetical protein